MEVSTAANQTENNADKATQVQKKPLNSASFEEFQKIDIRVGKIVECKIHPSSDYLYCLKVDIGTEVRDIGSGLQQYIPIDQVNGLVCVMANLKPRKLGGFDSNGMILCTNIDTKAFEFLRPHENSVVGERIFLEGQQESFKQELEPQLNQKKKILERALLETKTDDECVATFKNVKWMTKSGYVKAKSFKNSPID
ncbi:hypothetical protein TTHERM_00047530 (macronuclear) [Tetrahymena thermophila SB210]|uniref:tRNA-binding domain-containing protein n=1 Tax=Tetrahymena thermophila (strain SB210) TaxID=312017 RepID=Q23DD8_TETTS|nr:hypothetical protein TTHERM_00047530 [Tetrahymena thermophila SB210]EAR94545.1 hypothetical protein TTHERM_00047530 [Tetrahymena thermophila SB210]|eukprot:XP_001014748.1 hypothetical protein TTHERM_00047530 [Tetrahymena thermophila SB210]